MKTIVLGDIHGHSSWKDVIAQEKEFDRIIFLGDYFDAFHVKIDTQVNNFLDILEFRKTSGKEVILLVGNHDHHYIREIGYSGTSGYQSLGKTLITPILDANRESLQLCYRMDEYIFTHAGISEIFLNETYNKLWHIDNVHDLLNETFRENPLRFTFNGFNSYGDDMCQTPIWIRPRSLLRANKDSVLKSLIQIVGHTAVSEIDKEGKATGGRYYFIDCLGTSGEYVIITNNVLSFGKLKKE